VGKSTYTKPYAEIEANVSLPIVHDGSDVVELIVKIGDCEHEVDVFGAYFQRTGGTGEVQIQLDAEVLVNDPTGGMPDTNFLFANLDLDGVQNLPFVDLIEGATYTPSPLDQNIFRSGGIAESGGIFSSDRVGYEPNLRGFNYSGLRNKNIVIRSTVLSGENTNVESILYLRVVQYEKC